MEMQFTDEQSQGLIRSTEQWEAHQNSSAIATKEEDDNNTWAVRYNQNKTHDSWERQKFRIHGTCNFTKRTSKYRHQLPCQVEGGAAIISGSQKPRTFKWGKTEEGRRWEGGLLRILLCFYPPSQYYSFLIQTLPGHCLTQKKCVFDLGTTVRTPYVASTYGQFLSPAWAVRYPYVYQNPLKTAS